MTDILRLGIVGAGMIARIITKAEKASTALDVVAIASRREEKARMFAKEESIEHVFPTWQEMLVSPEIDAIYIATPTDVKEEISVAAAINHKHILVDKPFESLASLERIIHAAKQNEVSFMDATHFSHHERTAQLKQHQDEIGQYESLRTTFFIKSDDKTNIRFNPKKEPMGAIGDMGWYCMRAIVEYLAPTTEIHTMSGYMRRDKETNAVTRGTGYVLYKEGSSATFDFGYNVGACLMDLDILAENGMLRVDDFVLDWASGFTEPNNKIKTGYQKIIGVQSPDKVEYITVPSHTPQIELMFDHFVTLIRTKDSAYQDQCIHHTLQTQSLIDSFWHSARPVI